jgi:hypothetical protein
MQISLSPFKPVSLKPLIQLDVHPTHERQQSETGYGPMI